MENKFATFCNNCSFIRRPINHIFTSQAFYLIEKPRNLSEFVHFSSNFETFPMNTFSPSILSNVIWLSRSAISTFHRPKQIQLASLINFIHSRLKCIRLLVNTFIASQNHIYFVLLRSTNCCTYSKLVYLS